MRQTARVSGAASGFGQGSVFGLVKGGHQGIVGADMPQVWKSRHAARAEGAEMQGIKPDGPNEIDRAKAPELDVDVLHDDAARRNSLSINGELIHA